MYIYTHNYIQLWTEISIPSVATNPSLYFVGTSEPFGSSQSRREPLAS